jgi:hypothetical protein
MTEIGVGVAWKQAEMGWHGVMADGSTWQKLFSTPDHILRRLHRNTALLDLEYT